MGRRPKKGNSVRRQSPNARLEVSNAALDGGALPLENGSTRLTILSFSKERVSPRGVGKPTPQGEGRFWKNMSTQLA